jgi:hypothetical protein
MTITNVRIMSRDKLIAELGSWDDGNLNWFDVHGTEFSEESQVALTAFAEGRTVSSYIVIGEFAFDEARLVVEL